MKKGSYNMINFKWNVYLYNINKREIVSYNVFNHSSFFNEIINLPTYNRKKFEDQLRRIMQYYFWSKSEMEIVLTSWPPYIDPQEYDRITKEINNRRAENREFRVCNVSPTVFHKIDVYDQLMMNWDQFVNYVWASCKKRKSQNNSVAAEG